MTECITGIDLVCAQIAVAHGEILQLGPITSRGHAIEVRLNAEDADRSSRRASANSFASIPPSGPGIRVDTGFVADTVIPSEFDSMLAKLIVTGATREEARARLEEALASLHDCH